MNLLKLIKKVGQDDKMEVVKSKEFDEKEVPVIALVVKHKNKYKNLLEAISLSSIKGIIDIEHVSQRNLDDSIFKQAKKALLGEQKTLLITNAPLTLDEIIEIKRVSGNYLRLVSLNELDLLTLSTQSEFSLVDNQSFERILDLTLGSDKWFSFSGKSLYFEKDGYMFDRYNPYLDHYIYSYSKTVPVDQDCYKNTVSDKRILISPGKARELNTYKGLVDLVEKEYKYIENYVAEFQV